MNEEQLQAIEARANAATPGPWEEVAESGDWWITGPDIDYVVPDTTSMGEENIAFICASRTDVPALIAEVRSLRAKLDAVPVQEIQTLHHVAFGSSARPRINETLDIIGDWLDAQEANSEETD